MHSQSWQICPVCQKSSTLPVALLDSSVSLDLIVQGFKLAKLEKKQKQHITFPFVYLFVVSF